MKITQQSLRIGVLAMAMLTAACQEADPYPYPNPRPRDHLFSDTLNSSVRSLVEKSSKARFDLVAQARNPAFFQVDLSTAFNHDTVAWLGSGYTLVRLTSGEHRYYGVPFRIAEPSGKNVIAMQSDRFKQMPLSVSVPVNKRADAVYFLHACGWAAWGQTRQYVVHYADGTKEAINISPAGTTHGESENVQDWYESDVVDKAEAKFVALPNPDRPSDVSDLRYIYVLEWRNPHADREIKSFEFLGGVGSVSMFVFSVTLVEAK